VPNHFYHSTVQYEQSINIDAIRILGKIKDEITARFREKYKSDEKTIYGWTINVNSINPYALKADGEEISFRLAFRLKRLEGGEIYDAPKIKYLLSERMATLEPGENELLELKWLHVEGFLIPLPFVPESADKNAVLKTIFPYGETEGFAPDLVIMPISRELDFEIRNFVSGTRGFPANSSGHFIRMLYLSAITITTVGYGDILPITTTARALVSSEAVLGIIIIGLFLNSLWYERTKIQDDASP
jgi:hypothetical protein